MSHTEGVYERHDDRRVLAMPDVWWWLRHGAPPLGEVSAQLVRRGPTSWALLSQHGREACYADGDGDGAAPPLGAMSCRALVKAHGTAHVLRCDLPRVWPPPAAMAAGLFPNPQAPLAVMAAHPATLAIWLANVLAAYALYARGLTAEDVGLSYAAVVERREWWRVFTSTFAHFDPLHIVFNMSSLYNLCVVEDEVGSLAYLYVSLALAPLTGAVELAIRAYFISRGGSSARHRSANVVGYSGVIFAWMVVATALTESFCPIPMVPLCFETKELALPFDLGMLRANLAPFASLGFVSVIVPKASFVGHLAGIVAGFPVAWHLVDWCTPPVSAALCALGVAALDRRPTALRNPWAPEPPAAPALVGGWILRPTAAAALAWLGAAAAALGALPPTLAASAVVCGAACSAAALRQTARRAEAAGLGGLLAFTFCLTAAAVAAHAEVFQTDAAGGTARRAGLVWGYSAGAALAVLAAREAVHGMSWLGHMRYGEVPQEEEPPRAAGAGRRLGGRV